MVEEREKIMINSEDEDPYVNLDWTPYKGKEVDVVYRKDKDIIVPQLVTSKDLIRKDDERLADLVEDFLLRAPLTIASFYDIAEVGRWMIRGQNIYTSNIFTSYSMNSIKAEDAFPPLTKTVQEALNNEPESDLKDLILMHTHPKPNTPLSPGDYRSVEKLAGDFGMEKGDTIKILAIPINEKGNLIFSYDLCLEH